jgi:hypothetical protein
LRLYAVVSPCKEGQFKLRIAWVALSLRALAFLVSFDTFCFNNEQSAIASEPLDILTRWRFMYLSHSALKVADVLEQIAEHTNIRDRLTLYRCAMVSREWHNSFIAHLWHNHASFHHLYRLVANVHIRGSDKNFVVPNEPSGDVQLAGWRKYAPFLTRFTVLEQSESFKVAVATLAALSRSLDGASPQDLLPVVKKMEFPNTTGPESPSQEDLRTVFRFMPSALEHIAILQSDGVGNKLISALVSHAAEHLPHLETFELMGGYHSGDLQLKTMEHLESLTSLRHVVIPLYFVSGDLLLQLATMPSITTLNFTSESDCISEDELQFMDGFIDVAARVKQDHIRPFPHLNIEKKTVASGGPGALFTQAVNSALDSIIIYLSLGRSLQVRRW